MHRSELRARYRDRDCVSARVAGFNNQDATAVLTVGFMVVWVRSGMVVLVRGRSVMVRRVIVARVRVHVHGSHDRRRNDQGLRQH